jgi:hypothetical protein
MRPILLFFVAGNLVAGPLTFSMSGTFNSSQNTHSPYFAPNATWSLSFVVNNPPAIEFSSPDNSYFETEYSDGSYTLNGSSVPVTGYDVYFDTGTTTFLDFCLDSACHNQIDFQGAAIFTGPVTDPTLSSGSYPSSATVTGYYVVSQDQPVQHDNPGVTVDVVGTGDPSPTPEPATMVSVAGGLLAFGLARRRRSSRGD